MFEKGTIKGSCGFGETGILVPWEQKCEMVQLLWEVLELPSKTLNAELQDDSEIPLQFKHPK